MYARRYKNIPQVVVMKQVTLKSPKPAKIRKSVLEERKRRAGGDG
jgi:hypothetical protein